MSTVSDEEIKEKISSSLVDGKLLCPVAFKIAQDMGVSPRRIGDAANEMDVKIAACQLGCFP